MNGQKLSEWLRKRNKQPTMEDFVCYEGCMERAEAALAAREEPQRRRVPGMQANLFGDPASRAASARQREAFERQRSVPGPPKPPQVAGHMGYPRQEVISAARAVFGAIAIIEEDGMDVADLRRQAKFTLEATGLREADLLAAREDTERPEDLYDDEYALRDEEGDFRCFGSRRDLEACLLEGETLMMRKVSDWNFVVRDTEQEPKR